MISALGDLHGLAQTRYTSDAFSQLPSSAAGKVHVPVAPSLVIYRQFKHVSGIPASDGQSGVNIDKISILNALIERLSHIKQTPIRSSEVSHLTENQIDSLIKDYQSRIQNVVNIAKSNPYVLQGAGMPQTGAVFSIAV